MRLRGGCDTYAQEPPAVSCSGTGMHERDTSPSIPSPPPLSDRREAKRGLNTFARGEDSGVCLPGHGRSTLSQKNGVGTPPRRAALPATPRLWGARLSIARHGSLLYRLQTCGPLKVFEQARVVKPHVRHGGLFGDDGLRFLLLLHRWRRSHQPATRQQPGSEPGNQAARQQRDKQPRGTSASQEEEQH